MILEQMVKEYIERLSYATLMYDIVVDNEKLSAGTRVCDVQIVVYADDACKVGFKRCSDSQGYTITKPAYDLFQLFERNERLLQLHCKWSDTKNKERRTLVTLSKVTRIIHFGYLIGFILILLHTCARIGYIYVLVGGIIMLLSLISGMWCQWFRKLIKRWYMRKAYKELNELLRAEETSLQVGSWDDASKWDDSDDWSNLH